jgi:hypothetical protein
VGKLLSNEQMNDKNQSNENEFERKKDVVERERPVNCSNQQHNE